MIKDRLRRVGNAVFWAWYVPNIAWNVYTLAHADPTQLTDKEAVIRALVLPWPFSNPQVPVWIDIIVGILIVAILLWVNNKLGFLGVMSTTIATWLLVQKGRKNQSPSTGVNQAAVKKQSSAKEIVSVIFKTLLYAIVSLFVIGLFCAFFEIDSLYVAIISGVWMYSCIGIFFFLVMRIKD